MEEKKKNQTWEIILKVMASANVGAFGKCGMPGKVVKQKKRHPYGCPLVMRTA